MSDSKTTIVANEVPSEIQNFPRVTDHDEIATAQKTTGFAIPSYSAPTELRSKTSSTGTNAGVNNHTTGEIEIRSGGDSTGSASIETKRRGIYQPGSTSVYGIGIRLSDMPSGDQDIKWGYFDSQNGVGWGADSEGLYIFLRRNGSIEEKAYRSNFSEDPLDGSGESGLDIDLLEGVICQGEMQWYGYGPVTWQVNARRTRRGFTNPEPNQTTAHGYLVREDTTFKGNSIDQPNLPLRVEVNNNGTASDISAYVGGRQYAVLGGTQRVPARLPADEVYQYSLTANQGNYEPIIAIRKRSTFRGYPNPINVFIQESTLRTDQDITIRATVGNTIDESNTNFTLPADGNWTNQESAVETAKITDQLSVSDDGFTLSPIRYKAGGGNSKGNDVIRSSSSEEFKRFAIDDDDPFVIWARPDTGNATQISTSLGWEELF